MLLIKVDLPILYSSMKKKIIKIWRIFDIENYFENQTFQYQIKQNT